MTSSPLKLINRSEERFLVDTVSLCVSRWQEKWWANPQTIHDISLANDRNRDLFGDREWLTFHDAQAELLSIGKTPNSMDSFIACLLGQRGLGLNEVISESILFDLIEQVWADLGKMLAGIGNGQNANCKMISKDMSAVSAGIAEDPLRGYAVMNCKLAEETSFILVLSPSIVNAWLHDLPMPTGASIAGGLTAVSDALSSLPVHLEAIVGETELTAEEIGMLATDHVIPLNRRLGEPLEVRIIGDGLLFRAFLGATQGRRSIQIV